MSRIKNLYLKLLSNPIKPNEEQIEELLHQKAFAKAYGKIIEESSQEEFELLPEKERKAKIKEKLKETKQEVENEKESIIEENTTFSHRLLKLSKFPLLDSLVKTNASQIKEYGQFIFVKEPDYKELLIKSKIEYIEKIDIYYDSDVIMCTILPISKEILLENVKEGLLSIDSYEEAVEKYKL